MLTETVDELRTIAIAADDAAGYFPAMYARVTDRIQRAAADGDFDDSEGMTRFAQAFAEYYLRPRRGDVTVPACWRATWDVADDHRLLIVQHLLLGMNAHINHDLPLVVVDLADRRGDLTGMRRDFDAVNMVLTDTMPEVLRDLGKVSRWVNVLAARGGGKLFNFSLRAARSQAWHASERLHRLDADARLTEAAELDRLVTVLAYLVTQPGRPTRWLLPLARLLEARDPHHITRSLLGQLA